MVLLESVLYGKVGKGERAPDFNLKGIDGQIHSLKDFEGKKAVLVVFMCNHCPYVKFKIDVITALDREFRGSGLQVIGINSNDSSKYPDDSFEKMKEFAQERGIEFPYLVDETQEIARAYGASCTPDPYLLNSRLELVYHGRFDDALEPGSTPKTAEMREAVQQLLEGKAVSIEAKPSIGCSIKWKD